MRKIRRIVVHCTDSRWGDVLDINAWHRARGFLKRVRNYFLSIGYHFLILNGFSEPDEYFVFLDGSVQPGRPVRKVGAHVRGKNRDSIGVAFVGGKITPKQETVLVWVVRHLMLKHRLTSRDVVGHCELDPKKPRCPGINMDDFRGKLSAVA